jgi:hypothetical protein
MEIRSLYSRDWHFAFMNHDMWPVTPVFVICLLSKFAYVLPQRQRETIWLRKLKVFNVWSSAAKNKIIIANSSCRGTWGNIISVLCIFNFLNYLRVKTLKWFWNKFLECSPFIFAFHAKYSARSSSWNLASPHTVLSKWINEWRKLHF